MDYNSITLTCFWKPLSFVAKKSGRTPEWKGYLLCDTVDQAEATGRVHVHPHCICHARLFSGSLSVHDTSRVLYEPAVDCRRVAPVINFGGDLFVTR